MCSHAEKERVKNSQGESSGHWSPKRMPHCIFELKSYRGAELLMSTAVDDITSGGNEVKLNSKMKITKLYSTEIQ